MWTIFCRLFLFRLKSFREDPATQRHLYLLSVVHFVLQESRIDGSRYVFVLRVSYLSDVIVWSVSSNQISRLVRVACHTAACLDLNFYTSSPDYLRLFTFTILVYLVGFSTTFTWHGYSPSCNFLIQPSFHVDVPPTNRPSQSGYILVRSVMSWMMAWEDRL